MNLIPNDGLIMMLEAVAALIRNEYKEIIGAIETFRDITVSKQREQEITYLSQHDSLTGLLNRGYLDKVRERLSQKENYPLAVINADLNNLKYFNDNFTHETGDRVLITFAGIIQKEEKENDLIVRLGGDEFLIVMTNTTLETAQKRLDMFIHELVQTSIKGAQIQAAFGLAFSASNDKSLSQLLKEAESSMYQEKKKYYENKNPMSKR